MTRLALLLCLAFCGCVRPPRPVPVPPVADTEMGRYFEAFRATVGQACGDTADAVLLLADDDEAGARKVWGQNLQRAAQSSHGEVSATEQALSDAGWSNAKFAEILRRRQREATRD